MNFIHGFVDFFNSYACGQAAAALLSFASITALLLVVVIYVVFHLERK